MVRSSIAIQRGSDPSQARFEPFVRQDAAGQPIAFFPPVAAGDEVWEWPLHGIALSDALVLFTQRVTRDASALGFRTLGAGAYFVADARGPPSTWKLVALPLPDRADVGLIGVAVLARDEHVYLYGVRDPGDRALTLLRCRRAGFALGRFEQVEVWGGPAVGFVADGAAKPLLEPAANELSVTPRERGGYVLVQSRGFGVAPIQAWLAREPWGPFTGPVTLFDPGARGEPDDRRLSYAAKAHAGLAGAELVLTYVESSLDPERLLGDLGLYFPRVLRVELPLTP